MTHRDGFRSPRLETMSDHQEKMRRSQKVTIGMVEDMVQGLFMAVKEVTDECLKRTDALAAHTGYVPPKDPKEAQVDAIMEAQKAGIDTE